MAIHLKLCVSIAALALTACEASGDPSAEAQPEADAASNESDAASDAVGAVGGDAPITPESGWLTIGSDGAVQTTFLDPGGRYRDLRNGALVAEGSWQQNSDGALCFEPDSGRGACWETGRMADDGTALATSGEGKRIVLRRVAYVAPPAPEDSE